MKKASMIFGSFLIGATLTVFVTLRPEVAPWYSQMIYDCGIRVAADVYGGELRGFHITNHKIGICIDGGHSPSINDNEFSSR